MENSSLRDPIDDRGLAHGVGEETAGIDNFTGLPKLAIEFLPDMDEREDHLRKRSATLESKVNLMMLLSIFLGS